MGYNGIIWEYVWIKYNNLIDVTGMMVSKGVTVPK